MTLTQARREYRADPSAITAIVYFETAEDVRSIGRITESRFDEIAAELSRWDMSRPLCEYLDGTADPYSPLPAAE